MKSKSLKLAERFEKQSAEKYMKPPAHIENRAPVSSSDMVPSFPYDEVEYPEEYNQPSPTIKPPAPELKETMRSMKAAPISEPSVLDNPRTYFKTSAEEILKMLEGDMVVDKVNLLHMALLSAFNTGKASKKD